MERLKAVEELVKTVSVRDQSQLVELLKKKYGIVANQAVVSRDLRKLGVVKKKVKGVFCYDLPQVNVKREILRLALIDIVHNETTIVIKTEAGLAAFVGDYVDQQEDLDILGSLAGENVVFVAPKSIKHLRQVYEKICERFYFKKD